MQSTKDKELLGLVGGRRHMIRQVSGILFSDQNSGPELSMYWTQYDAKRDANSLNSC